MEIKKINATQSMTTVCNYFPSVIADACNLALLDLAPKVAPLIESGENPDAVCNALSYCTPETAVCRLFPPNRTDREFVEHTARLRSAVGPVRAFNICTILPGVCAMADHKPFFDSDGDMFSTYDSLRGAYWRGRDCDDLNSTIFPGRDSSDAIVDENCNGIFGIDLTTGKTYEDEWCRGTGAMGVAALGDSATAHFRIPPDYITASKLSKETFANVLRLLENEGDWPMLSWSTGHLNASGFSPDIEGPMSSLYSMMLENNRCNHRDYQNVGVNGARVGDLLDFDSDLSRNSTSRVKPLLLVMSMIGNDVCGSSHSFSSMTTPEEYYSRIVAALDKADGFLPASSHVVLIPLVDGRILFDAMHNRIHPIGSTNNDVTYTNLYDYLNCLQISPCWGWMNSNASVRNGTWAVAQSLNAQLPIIANQSVGKYKNVKVHYLGNVFDEGLARYAGPKWQLIEPVDGFHPSQWGNALLGQFLFNATLKAGIIPPPNPNNEKIINKFGNQGGH
jgi:acyloxyacyl hydrolase